MPMHNPNFTLDKKFIIEQGYIIPPRIQLKYNNPKLDLIHEALHSALFMASQIDLVSAQGLFCRPDTIRPSYLRACVMELCRIEDLSKLLSKRISFSYLDDPVFHIIKILRNYEIHLTAHELAYGGIDILYKQEVMSYESYIIGNLNFREFKKLHSVKYDDEILLKLIEWFDAEQKKLGITQFLFNAIKYLEQFLFSYYKNERFMKQN